MLLGASGTWQENLRAGPSSGFQPKRAYWYILSASSTTLSALTLAFVTALCSSTSAAFCVESPSLLTTGRTASCISVSTNMASISLPTTLDSDLPPANRNRSVADSEPICSISILTMSSAGFRRPDS